MLRSWGVAFRAEMMRATSSFASWTDSDRVCATSRICLPCTIPMVCQRNSPSTSRSWIDRWSGSSKTSTAVSKLIPCFLRFARFFRSSHVNCNQRPLSWQICIDSLARIGSRFQRSVQAQAVPFQTRSELRFQPSIRLFQRFRQHARLPHHSHEIGVGHPAGQDVHVDVSGNPGARRLTDVHSKIYAVWVIELSQDGLKTSREQHHLVGGGLGQQIQAIDVLVRHNHDMTRGVGKGVEDDEIQLRAMDDEGFPVVAGVEQLAKDTAFRLGDRGDVGIAPGSPEVVHHWAEYQSPASPPKGVASEWHECGTNATPLLREYCGKIAP